MLISLCLLGLSRTIAFMGGDAAEFASKLNAETGRPVVAMAAHPVCSFTAQLDIKTDANGWSKLMQHIARCTDQEALAVRSTNPRLAGGYVFRPKALPLWFSPRLDPQKAALYESRFGTIEAAPVFEEGTVSCQAHPNKFYSGYVLRQLPLKKPLKFHWHLERLRFAAAGKFASEQMLLEAVAKALGGRFVETQDEYRIDFDGKAYREQLLESLKRDRAGLVDLYSIAYNEFRQAVVSSLSGRQIEEAFASESSFIRFDAYPDSLVGRAAARLVEAFRRTDFDPATGAIVGTGAADLLQHADFS